MKTAHAQPVPDPELVAGLERFVSTIEARLPELKGRTICILPRDWIAGRHASAYLRLSRRVVENELVLCFDLASISVDEDMRGQGIVRDLIGRIEMQFGSRMPIFVESVLEPRLARFLHGRGYRAYEIDGGRSVMRPPRPEP